MWHHKWSWSFFISRTIGNPPSGCRSGTDAHRGRLTRTMCGQLQDQQCGPNGFLQPPYPDNGEGWTAAAVPARQICRWPMDQNMCIHAHRMLQSVFSTRSLFLWWLQPLRWDILHVKLAFLIASHYASLPWSHCWDISNDSNQSFS